MAPINDDVIEMKVIFLLAVAATLGAMHADQSTLETRLEALRAADFKVGATLYRLATANDQLCEKHGPGTGLVLHGSSDYDESVRAEVKRHFDFESPVAVEAVVADSPASRAGIEPDDSILAINGKPLASGETRADVLAALDATAPTQPLSLTLERRGRALSTVVHPVSACLAHVEVSISDDLNAATDGKTIQVDSALVNLVGDDQGALAAILAHELSHIVLDHPQRLTAAHVDRGFFRIFGKSLRLIRQTENEADRLSVTLMANAGYDPQAAVRYWKAYGQQLNDHGGFGSAHLSWRKRADLIAKAAARLPRTGPLPIIPGWISSRNTPLH